MTKVIQPKYTVTLPSDGSKIQFRPFTVREEKALLLSLQEGSVEDIANAIRNLLLACTDDAFDSATRPFYDSEYLFLKIRAKSIGEVIDLIGKCDCSEEAKTEVAVDLEQDLRIEPSPKPSEPFAVPGTSTVLKFRHPSMANFLELNDKEDNSTQILAKCISEAYTDDEVLKLTESEGTELLESLTSLQQKSLKSFLKEMPMVKLDVRYKCRKCNKDHHEVLSGFENFFV